ncbi:MAG: hypothetical protein H6586_06700 [Flavobacteriales bacterium]|nr:hypothetical protein [Flavobacteriales bacterium]
MFPITINTNQLLNIFYSSNDKRKKRLVKNLNYSFTDKKIKSTAKEELSIIQFKEITGIKCKKHQRLELMKIYPEISRKFTWKMIKNIFPYLLFENDKIIPKVSSLNWAVFIFQIIGALFWVFILIALPSLKVLNTISYMFTVISAGIFFGVFFFSSISNLINISWTYMLKKEISKIN